MPAVSVTKPTMLNQAVNQAQVGPPSSADQWYVPPEVGIAEQSSAMLSATKSVPKETSGQPKVISDGPRHLKAVVVQREYACDNGNDGEGNGEGGEATHAAQQFLRVAETLELAGITLGLHFFALGEGLQFGVHPCPCDTSVKLVALDDVNCNVNSIRKNRQE